MTLSKVLLLVASTIGLIWKIRVVFAENRAKARDRMRDSAERRWGMSKRGIFDEPEEEDDAFWE